MLTEELLIEDLIKCYESVTGWGDSKEWKNQDFIVLSEKIQMKTGEAISHVTLKRIWGRIKYDSLPNSHTLDTLVKYLDYENWREFRIKTSGNGQKNSDTVGTAHVVQGNTVAVEKEPAIMKVLTPQPQRSGKIKAPKKILVFITAAIVVAIPLVWWLFFKPVPVIINDNDYSFSSKKVVTTGVPNSVVFSYDATKAPTDSVIIQQSWDRKLRQTVSKKDHQHTSVYYFPDFYHAKLIVGGRIVKQHNLLIKSGGWLSLITQKPIPVYFDRKDAMVNGKLSLSKEKIQAKNIKMQPSAPNLLYSYVDDLGEVYTDDFVFETSLKNDYKDGANVCQSTKIYILCEGTAIWVPLCTKGCVSDIDLYFANYSVSGKQHDLSAFGVDFDKFVDVKIVSHKGKAQVYINNKLAYSINGGIARAKIVGFDFQFQGTGSIDYVKLYNNKVHFDEEF